jgi:hypothetical protein
LLAAIWLAELTEQDRSVRGGDVEDLQAAEPVEKVESIANDSPDIGLGNFARR